MQFLETRLNIKAATWKDRLVVGRAASAVHPLPVRSVHADLSAWLSQRLYSVWYIKKWTGVCSWATRAHTLAKLRMRS